METTKKTRRPERVAAAGGTASLVAADRHDPGQACMQGELVWTGDCCGDAACPCDWAFTGASSGGVTKIAEVRRLPGVGRSAIRSALIAAMTAAGHDRACAAVRTDAQLRLAASLPDGTLLRRELGVPVAISIGGAPW